ncbi:Late embryogenesis abundant protein [Vigna unguiculata]|uniref:Late embryogenesis abundant protein n=1 Tax=Vigna unguiculata TaxID=3917 RepID=A0A4D6LUK7_VIGUN|nr:Late embryogenesis abundant protein [Vigna unguiculata]
MTGKDEFVSYSPLPSNPNPNPYAYHYPNPSSYPQNVVILLPTYRPRLQRRRRRCILYSSALFFFLLVAGAAFLLFPSDPEVRLVRIGLNRIGIRTNPKPILDLSFSLTVKVRNRDFFSLSYDTLVVSVGYRGRPIGLVSVPGDGVRIRARASSYVDATLTVDGFEVLYDAFYLLEDIAKGVIPFDTESRVEGKLGLFFFTVPLKATVSCEVYVNINQQRIVRQDCYPKKAASIIYAVFLKEKFKPPNKGRRDYSVLLYAKL